MILVHIAFIGCSSYNRDWRNAGSTPVSLTSADGRWEGTWISEKNGHGGKLRCLMTPVTNLLYNARYRATYGGIFHFTYTARLTLEPHDTGWEFNGQADLGKLAGGVYYYEGRATSNRLLSSYSSKYDNGQFDLIRPK